MKFTIIGCGGDRDRQKRPIMFHIASKIADTIIITSDNPRTEDPKKIIEDMICFLNQKDNQLKNNVFVIDEIRKIDNKYNNPISQKQIIDKTIIEIDRKKAIILGVKQYLNKTKQKTALLIAGKGHEDYQINGNIKIFKLLKKFGAKEDCYNIFGYSPWDLVGRSIEGID